MHFNGLIAAPFTAMDNQGALNLDQIEVQARALTQVGVQGAFVCGTTGEGASLTMDERKHVAQRWCEVRPVGLKVIVHVGHSSLAEAQALASHAQQFGADAVAAIAPYFFKPSSISMLGQWCRELASAAPDLPFYYYHMPQFTGVNLPMETFITREAPTIPNFAGIKFTHEDLYDFGRCIDLGADCYQMLFGRDEMLLSALPLGATAAVGSTYNYAAPIYLNMINAYRQGHMQKAQSYQRMARQIVNLLKQHGGLAAGKAIMQLIGIDCGPVRLPLEDLNTSQRQALHDDLKAIGFYNAIKESHAISQSNDTAFAMPTPVTASV